MDAISPVPDQAPHNERIPAADSNPDLSNEIRDDIRNEEPIPGSNFAFTPSQLHKLLTYRNLIALDVFGGIRGLAAGLRTDVDSGLSIDETGLQGKVSFDEAVAAGEHGRAAALRAMTTEPEPPSRHLTLRIGEEQPEPAYVNRKRIFGANRLPRRKQKSFLRLMWIAYNDKLLILLSISAVISLAIGIYQSVDVGEGGSNIEWVDGVTVVVAIVVIVLASAATDWQKNHKFEKLNERKSQRDVPVVRSGRVQHVSVYEVMVGDIMHIEAGEVIPADGVLVKGSGLYIDESSVSGEAGMVQKTIPSDHDSAHATNADPFIFSGTTVTRGVGRFVVTSVGANSMFGRTLMSLREDVEETPLQAKLGRLGKQLIMFGAAAGSVFFFILFVRFLVNLKYLTTINDDGQEVPAGPSQKAEAFFRIFMLAIAVVVITVPEGLALNVTVALAFATKRMLRDNNLVRLIRSVEIMGNATSICSDKTGTLTQNKMTVVAGRVGMDASFDDSEMLQDMDGGVRTTTVMKGDTSSMMVTSLSSELKELLKDSIAINSTAFESDESKAAEFFGSSTETALLKFGRDHLGMNPLREERANCPTLTMLPFDSSRKWMAVLIKLADGKYRLLVKGAAEVVFEYCAYYVADPTYRIMTDRLSEEDRATFRTSIQEYANAMLRPVAMAFRDFDASEVFENPDDDPATINLEWLASGLVFLGVFGIRDPLRREVLDSVRICQNAGVFVRMVTGDNFITAKAIAGECGIYTPGGIAMDGPTFRRLSPAQMDIVVPRLQVLARSSPEDKLLLVSHLRGMNETVAVTGDGTNDALALKAADVGFAMGIQGTEVSKEAASIILLDDNFTSIVKGLSWGRTVNDAVKKFCQFQFTINITAGIATVITELVGEEDNMFDIVQLLWINLIMDVFASLGLATDHPSPDFLKRKPEPRGAPIVTITMWKMILCQAIYQLLVVFLVHYVGKDLFTPDNTGEYPQLQTLVFNIYVWMQFFNQHNCRRVDNKLDIWYQGVLRNPWFLGVQALTCVGQFVIIFKGGEAFNTVPLTGAQWGWSILFGIITIPLGALIRQIPDRWVLSLFRAIRSVWRVLISPLRACWGRVWTQRRKKSDAENEPETAVDNVVARTERVFRQHIGEEMPEMTEEQRAALAIAAQRRASIQNPEAEVDLQALVDAAKLGRSIPREVFEIHPGTAKEDPILTPRKNLSVPPSQDESILRYLQREDEPTQNRRRKRVPARSVWVEQPRRTGTQQHPKARNGFTWEAFLRSKRR
ncbi:hypothetical protein VHEMI04753 [[Torrubiella] hemipterigena]|uniref:Calcium-transporting ATPase n=1 Tax=[Torrubiella] hemipterigena TaxID=1531966 RepID=A0A0A1SW51_9HYPO|nr:hypothetical protein VHEMI04753 [[Torrubiella] hemipterigena]